MKAVILPKHGDRSVLEYTEDFPEPSPGAGEALIKVASTTMNQVDLMIREGYPGIEVTLPHIMGGDVAGTVEAVEAGSDDSLVGKRVLANPLISCNNCALCTAGKPSLCLNWKFIGMHIRGGYAEYAVIPVENLIAIPDSVSFEDAACLPVAGLTAYHALHSVGELKPGEIFFLWGGSSGVGTFAIQIAKAIGAGVIAVTSSEEKAEDLRKLGADLVIDRNTADVEEAVRGFAPQGVELALDFVGTETFQKSFGLLKKGGTLLLCGMLTGRETNLSIHMTYLKHLSIKGFYLGTRDELEALLALVSNRVVNPVIHRILSLSDAPAAHALMEEGRITGKVVLSLA